jgi:CheY-like chemotaxis protein
VSRRVLIVDDEESILRSTALLLEDFGFEAHTVSRADEIVARALAVRPDVLLQDVRMPGLDIDRLVETCRSRRELEGIHIVLFTASMDIDQISERLGVRIVEKPFRPADLLAALG